VQLNLDIHRELLVDNFAGGGGASCGIESALGRRVDIAINHDARAVAMHQANHPETRHRRLRSCPPAARGGSVKSLTCPRVKLKFGY
jgi:site-specific DNA-cytosine methylase